MNNARSETKTGTKKSYALVKGTVGALLFTLIAFLVIAAVMLNVSATEWLCTLAAIAVGLICAFVGGFICARTVGKNGWLWGGCCGLTYYVILYLSALAAFAEFNFSFKTLAMLFIGTLCGALGGLFAMGSRKSKRG